MKKYASLLFLLGVSCSHWIQGERRPNSANALQELLGGEGSVYVSLPAAKKLTYPKLLGVLQRSQVQTVADLLKELQKDYPEYLSFHTYVYASRSLHESSFENPRAIVFGPEAKLILTFNGHSGQRSGGSVEMMDYLESESRFRFRELVFKKEQQNTRRPLEASDIESENSRWILSKPNIVKCADCHTKNYSERLTPIFAPYFVWPGVYGSNDDDLTMRSFAYDPGQYQFYDNSVKSPRSLHRDFQLKYPHADKETKEYLKFLGRKKSHPRYQWLPDRDSDVALELYRQGQHQVPEAVFSRIQSSMDQTSNWPLRPNSYLDLQLNRLTLIRLLKEVRAAGLENVFAGKTFSNRYYRSLSTPDYRVENVEALLTDMENFLKELSFVHKVPTLADIQKDLQFQIKLAYEVEKRNLREHLNVFPENALLWDSNVQASTMNLNLLKWVGKTPKSVQDHIAAKAISGVIKATLVNFVLKDRGLDLGDSSLSFLQTSYHFSQGDNFIHIGRLYDFMGLREF